MLPPPPGVPRPPEEYSWAVRLFAAATLHPVSSVHGDERGYAAVEAVLEQMYAEDVTELSALLGLPDEPTRETADVAEAITALRREITEVRRICRTAGLTGTEDMTTPAAVDMLADMVTVLQAEVARLRAAVASTEHPAPGMRICPLCSHPTDGHTGTGCMTCRCPATGSAG